MREISLHSLPLGLRFRPTDEEVFNYYLMHKISGHHEQVEFIREIDICKYEPWDLPALSTIKTIDLQWFFFCPQGWNRATNTGYWSETGGDQKIESGNKLIGMKKTLVYHFGRAPQGRRSSRWWMYEYRATSKHLDGTLPGQSPFVLCRLFRKEDEIYYLMPKDLKMQTLVEVSTFNSFQFQIYSSRKAGRFAPNFTPGKVGVPSH
ncbi:protein NTM1-like 9 isoform X2 [Mangifera indica]|uniref:protein NTM1-like 9 isoform X2 n=1 Tax=Mangifera indica TaxID=29780 RepID=UPI001CFBA8E2|nr:protein NTM1-like 9 isoform X2 [Mangifera indica]